MAMHPVVVEIFHQSELLTNIAISKAISMAENY